MAGSLEPPDPFKNSWEKFSFVIKPSEYISLDFGEFFSIIMIILLLLLYRLKVISFSFYWLLAIIFIASELKGL